MGHAAEMIAEQFARWGAVPSIVQDVFDRPTPEAMETALDAFCVRNLGAGVDRGEFFDASVGSVHGLRLLDGRRVVVKLHGSRASTAFLAAVQAVQRQLFVGGFPAPEPLVAPTPFGHGTAVVEALLDRGEHADAHQAEVRRAMAGSLAHFIERCRPLTTLRDLEDHLMVRGDGHLWPRPHDGRLDFGATSAGAEWIDAAAREARRVLDVPGGAGDRAVGHSDCRVQNMRFADGRLSALYDWDSVIVEREPVLVGGAAHGFTADFANEAARRQRPTLAESVAFVDEYEEARGTPFSPEERQVARAALVYSMAYAARCEHSDALLMTWGRPRVPADSARAFLASHGSELLGGAPNAT